MSDVAAVKCTVDIPSPEIRVTDYGRMVVTGDGGAAVYLEKERFLSKFKIQIIVVGYAIITTRGEDLDWKMRAFLSFAKCANLFKIRVGV